MLVEDDGLGVLPELEVGIGQLQLDRAALRKGRIGQPQLLVARDGFAPPALLALELAQFEEGRGRERTAGVVPEEAFQRVGRGLEFAALRVTPAQTEERLRQERAVGELRLQPAVGLHGRVELGQRAGPELALGLGQAQEGQILVRAISLPTRFEERCEAAFEDLVAQRVRGGLSLAFDEADPGFLGPFAGLGPGQETVFLQAQLVQGVGRLGPAFQLLLVRSFEQTFRQVVLGLGPVGTVGVGGGIGLEHAGRIGDVVVLVQGLGQLQQDDLPRGAGQLVDPGLLQGAPQALGVHHRKFVQVLDAHPCGRDLQVGGKLLQEDHVLAPGPARLAALFEGPGQIEPGPCGQGRGTLR